MKIIEICCSHNLCDFHQSFKVPKKSVIVSSDIKERYPKIYSELLKHHRSSIDVITKEHHSHYDVYEGIHNIGEIFANSHILNYRKSGN